MPILAMSAGRITAIWGSAHVRQPDGSLKALQVGDVVAGGTRILTDADGMVEISPISQGSAALAKSPPASNAVDEAIAGIEARDVRQVPVAGPSGDSAEGGLQPALRVERISEAGAGPNTYAFNAAVDANLGDAPGIGTQPAVSFQAPQAEPPLPPDPPAPPEAKAPHVASVSVVASDGHYVYFGIRLDDTGGAPTTLTLRLSPSGHPGADAWTGDAEYSLDAALSAMPGEDGITFQPFALGQVDQQAGVMRLDLPAQALPGLILLKVPVFVQDEAEAPHIDVVKLEASTSQDTTPRSGEAALLHGHIDIVPQGPVEEGGAAVFELSLGQALDRDVRLQLHLLDGVDDPATPENEGALVGVDTQTRLYQQAGDGTWVPLGDDGVLTLAAGAQQARIRVDTLDDQVPEDTEHIRLAVTAVEGDVILTGMHVGKLAILDNDADFDPVRGERVPPVSATAVAAAANDGALHDGAIGMVRLRLSDTAGEHATQADAPHQADSRDATLDVRDLMSDWALAELHAEGHAAEGHAASFASAHGGVMVTASLSGLDFQLAANTSVQAKLLIEQA